MRTRKEAASSARSTFARFLQRPLRAITKRLAVHENVKVGIGARIGRGVVISAPHHLVIGNYVSVGPRSIIQVDGTVDDFAIIGMGVQVVGRSDHAFDEVGVPVADATWVGDRAASPIDAVQIGRDVWLGGSCVVLSGISIGDAAIVGAGAVVVHDVPPGAIVAGNPAKFLRGRSDGPEMLASHLYALAAKAHDASWPADTRRTNGHPEDDE